MNDIEFQLSKLGLKRHNDVGKKIGSNVWMHITYATADKTSVDINYLKDQIDFCPAIVRIDRSSNKVALIESVDFDTANEPLVGRSALFTNNKILKITNPSMNPLIYHHKWMFVQDDYQEFNVQEAKERSLKWKALLGTNREVSSKIGRKSYWEAWINKRDIEK